MGMSEELWISYAGMFTGIIGAITGISGAVLGYIGYARSKKVKSLDLRLELRKAINILSDDLHRLPKLIADGNESKKRIASASGWLQSGRMTKWNQEIEKDKEKLDELIAASPQKTDIHDKLNEKELETHLVKIHDLQNSTNFLIKKYDASLLEDRGESLLLRKAAEDRLRPK